MSMFASLLVNAVIAASPVTPMPWFTLDDYPTKAFSLERQGVTTFALIVTPDGRPGACSIVESSGHSELDREACYIATRRPRFSPALGPDGHPTFGIYRSQVKWMRPDRPAEQREPGPDLEVSVSALPAGTVAPGVVKLAYFVDSGGKPSACTVLPESKKQPAKLAELACSQLFSKLPPDPVTSKNGPIAAVRTAAVKFSVAK